MATRWRTEPIPPHLHHLDLDLDHDIEIDMASTASRRPQIFVHFEFGVSFSPRHAPNQHSVTYVSRGMRDRAQHFPRQVPPPTTNYLNTPTYQAYQPTRSSPPAHQQNHPQNPPMPPHLEPRRQSRQESRSSGSSHERGSSAPPPWNDSPWDAEPDALGSSALPRQRPRAPTTSAPDYWKALPEVPSRFRLGEDELPWSASSWPGEYGMPDDSEVDDYSSELSMKFRDVSLANVTPAPRPRDREDPGRKYELEALSAAMMTVDNGFEDQWWYQGERQQTAPLADDLLTSSAYAPATATAEAVPQTPVQLNHRESAGWAVSEHEDPHMSLTSATVYNPSVLVSPMTEYASPRLHRSLTTRSEELFLFN
ncbi:hypothetical protein GCG54_00010157 [Colletotrichum gloeosporioides]|uniref:Uncharacterized protein n=1 Tax=Colletotrichum gloeosporioides TaxID=474922 RepID=A0A8H4FGM9_COLGL|nr:uncharacterized protein GCG54_00010157 [Colletotrichum gloeosporioides]KAF3801096.1 hypothetical protein GCG54_00010157 [Colletotrichum gloeosporioides]